MIMYEVNLDVDARVAGEYVEWLKEHVGRMLRFDGFLSAETFEQYADTRQNTGRRQFVVQYRVRDNPSLDRYFTDHAPEMRREGVERFPGRFTATRRVLYPAG